MFTQCSKCETVFRLSADALRTAGGQVRCGRCGEVFNALARLAEDSTGFVKGESPLDLETRADEILESSGSNLANDAALAGDPADLESAGESMPPPGGEVARLQILGPVDAELAEETSLEFTLPPGELDRIFVETPGSPLRPAAPDGVRGGRRRSDAKPLHGLEVAEGVREEMMASFAHAELPPINEPRRRLPFAVWLIAAIVLGIVLAAQLVLDNRGWLSAHTPLLRTGTVNLAAYQLRQWGVTGDPDAKGTLRVRASIMNSATQLQPYPLLRVTLVNRFGARVGAREFEPAEYLGKPTARMLAPGERADATLDILDPGRDAEGFEIDVCIRGPDQRIVCSADPVARAT